MATGDLVDETIDPQVIMECRFSAERIAMQKILDGDIKKHEHHGKDDIQNTEVVADGAGEEDEGADTLASLLEACADKVFISALPRLLHALPADAQDRCLIVFREALTEELEGGALEEDEAMQKTWRLALGCSAEAAEKLRVDVEPTSDATATSVPAQHALSTEADGAAKNPSKRPFRAMAVPFATVSVSKRPKESVGENQPQVQITASTTRLYVANVPYDAEEDEILQWFQAQIADTGKVQSVRLLLDAGKPKGAAIITFDTVEAAGKALALNGQLGLQDRRLIIKEDMFAGTKGEGKGRLKRGFFSDGKGTKSDGKAAKNEAKASKEGRGTCDASSKGAGNDKSVVVKNLAFNATEANIGELFAGCGEVSAVRIARDSRNGRSRGFAVVEFIGKEAVAEALRRGGQLVRGRPVRIEAMDAGVTLASAESEVVARDGATEPAPLEESGSNSATCVTESSEVSKATVDSSGDDCLSGTDAIRKHAQFMVAQRHSSIEVSQPPAKRSRGEKLTTPGEPLDIYPEGEAGLQAVSELLASHGTAEALLAAAGAESLKGRLVALGMKSSGSPLERAQRLFRLQGVCRTEEIPADLIPKSARRSGISNRAPIKFVKAGAALETPSQETCFSSRAGGAPAGTAEEKTSEVGDGKTSAHTQAEMERRVEICD